MSSELQLDVNVDVQGDSDLDRLNSQLGSTEQKTSKLGSVTTGVFQGMGQAVAGFGIGMVSAGIDAGIEAIGNSIELSSDKAEAASKVNVLYGESADQITRASETAATTVGMSSGAYLESAGNLGNLLTNMDLTQDAAAGMSVDMIQLAADVGSFNNADPTEVVEAMGAAFRGESEPIRRFGVSLDEASIKAKAMELGLYSGTGALDASARATATYQLILDDTSAAQGDFARTSDGLANQQRINAARMEDAWTRVGDSLAPLAAQILPVLADGLVWVVDQIGLVVEAIATWIDDNQELIDQLINLGRQIADTLGWALGILIDVIGELGYRVGGLIGLFVDLAGALVDTGAAIVKVLSGDFAGAAEDGQRALDRLGSFAENVQRAMGDTGRRVADEAVIAAEVTAQEAEKAKDAALASALGAWGGILGISTEGAADVASGVTDSTASGLRAGIPGVEGAATDMAATIPDALTAAGDQAQQIAAQTPGELAASLRSGRDDWRGALDQLKEDVKTSLSPAKEIANLEAVLAGKAISKGLNSTDPIVRAQAQETVDQIEARLNTLKGVGETAGEQGAGAIPGGMGSKDPAVQRAAASTTAIVSTQFDLMENGSRIAAQTANLTLSTTLQQGTGPAQRAGANVGDAWGAGVVQGIQRSRDAIARAASYATAPLQGHSPPRVGPLREIDEWGEAVGRAWWEPLAEVFERGARLLAGAAPGPALAPALAGASSSGPVYQVTVQAGVGDPVAIGREVVSTIQAYERSGGRDWRSTS